jgi:cyclase
MTIRTALATIAAALFTFCSTASAQGGFAPAELATTEVMENIYVIRSMASGNATALVSDHGVLLIDNKFASDHNGIVAQLAKVTDQPVRYVINTHLHEDHTGGNALLQALGAEDARRIMAETGAEGLPNITIDDYVRIYFGDFAIDIHYFGRGHTDGDIVIHLPEQRVVVMGDLFALYGPHRHLIDYGAGGSARDWSRTLERALKLEFDTVIPGHSGVTDRAMLESFLAETVRLQETVRQMNRQRRPREEIGEMLKTEFAWSDFMLGFGLNGIVTEMR